MRQSIKIIIWLFLLSGAGIAADPTSNPDKDVYTRKDWGAAEARGGLEKHSKYGFDKPVRIIIGHTAHSSKTIENETSVAIMLSMEADHMGKGWATIGYNFCVDKHGSCFNCRDCDIVPSFCKGENPGTCAIGIIGRFDEHAESQDVTDDMVMRIGKQIGRIAYCELGYTHLKHGENIFGISERSERFPVSPGARFMARFDEIIVFANNEIKRRSQGN